MEGIYSTYIIIQSRKQHCPGFEILAPLRTVLPDPGNAPAISANLNKK